MKSVRVMLAYQKTELGSCTLLQLMKYSLKSRHLITLKACSAKWKITVQKEETFLLNLHNFVNVNIPVLAYTGFLFVCYCSFHEIDSLISLSAEMDLFAFSNHRGKSNKLYTTRMHLQSLHAIGTACAFLANYSIKIILVLPRHLILKSYNLYRFFFWRGNQNVSLYNASSHSVSWTMRKPLDCHQLRTDLLWSYTLRDNSQAYRNSPILNVFWTTWFSDES